MSRSPPHLAVEEKWWLLLANSGPVSLKGHPPVSKFLVFLLVLLGVVLWGGKMSPGVREKSLPKPPTCQLLQGFRPVRSLVGTRFRNLPPLNNRSLRSRKRNCQMRLGGSRLSSLAKLLSLFSQKRLQQHRLQPFLYQRLLHQQHHQQLLQLRHLRQQQSHLLRLHIQLQQQ